MNKDEYMLSIIIPVYNGEKYIKECLESIFNANDENKYELIIINDGSTDNTKEILEQSSISNMKVFNNKNHGVSYSRNFGIKKATGKYIMFVDADDKLKKNWLSIIEKTIKNNDLDLAIFSSKKIDKSKIYNYITAANKENICIGAAFSKVIRKSILENNKILFDDRLINGEDMIFNCFLLEKCKDVKVINESIYLYRQTPNSTTNKFDERIIENDYRFNIIISDLLKNYKDITDYSKINGLYTILERISYCDKYNIGKDYIKLIKKDYYEFKIDDIKFLSRFKKRIIKLYYNEKYYLVFFVLKLRTKIKNLLKGKESFIEI